MAPRKINRRKVGVNPGDPGLPTPEIKPVPVKPVNAPPAKFIEEPAIGVGPERRRGGITREGGIPKDPLKVATIEEANKLINEEAARGFKTETAPPGRLPVKIPEIAIPEPTEPEAPTFESTKTEIEARQQADTAAIRQAGGQSQEVITRDINEANRVASLDIANARAKFGVAEDPSGVLRDKLSGAEITGTEEIMAQEGVENFDLANAIYKQRIKNDAKDPQARVAGAAFDALFESEKLKKDNKLEVAETATHLSDDNPDKGFELMESRFGKTYAENARQEQQIANGEDETSIALSALSRQKDSILESGGNKDGSDVLSYIQGVRDMYTDETGVIESGGDIFVQSAIAELIASPDLSKRGRDIAIAEFNRVSPGAQVSVREGGEFTPEFESLLEGAVGGFLSGAEFKESIKDLGATQKRELLAEKAKRQEQFGGTPEEKRIVTQVMRQLPTKLKDAILEKRERQQEILADVRAGRGVQDIVDELKGFIVTNNDQFTLGKELRALSAVTPDFDLTSISAPLNLNRPLSAIAAVENAVLPPGDDYSQANTERVLLSGRNVVELIDEVGDEFMGAINARMFETGQWLIPDNFLEELFPGDLEKQRKANELGSEMAFLFAGERRFFGGTALTETEAEFLKPLLADLKSQPRKARQATMSLMSRMLRGHNAARRQRNLPIFETDAQLLNDDQKLKLYEDQAFERRMGELGVSPDRIDAFKNATPEQREAVKKAIGASSNTTPTEGKSETRPVKNKNPINLKKGGTGDQFALKNPDGTPQTDDQGHLVFANAGEGIKAAEADLKAKVNGGSRFLPDNPTLAQLGNVFATDPNWAKGVASILGVDISEKTQNIDFKALFRAVARQEGGSSLLAQNG